MRIGPAQTAPERHYYVLDATRPSAQRESDARAVEAEAANDCPRGAADRPALEVRRFSISPLYAGREFVYRGANLASQTDYYSLFQIDPASLVTEATRLWLSDSGLFSRVQEPGSYVLADRILEGRVLALYADYADANRPRAVMEIEFALTAEAKGSDSLLLSRRYAQAVALSDPTPTALAAGWNDALGRILAQFESDLTGLSRTP